MGLVSELLANDGYLPQLAALYDQKPSIFTRKNGVIFTALWFIFFVMMMPAFFGIGDFEEGAAASAVFGLFTTVMLLIVSLGFLKRSPKPFERRPAMMPQPLPAAAPVAFRTDPSYGALPPQQSQPASSYSPPEGAWKTPDTGEFARPGSVTESTTRLLKKEE